MASAVGVKECAFDSVVNSCRAIILSSPTSSLKSVNRIGIDGSFNGNIGTAEFSNGRRNKTSETFLNAIPNNAACEPEHLPKPPTRGFSIVEVKTNVREWAPLDLSGASRFTWKAFEHRWF